MDVESMEAAADVLEAAMENLEATMEDAENFLGQGPEQDMDPNSGTIELAIEFVELAMEVVEAIELSIDEPEGDDLEGATGEQLGS